MITPVIDGYAELAAKLDMIPEVIRAAVAAEFERLGRARQRFRPQPARGFVLRTAGVPPALRAAIETAIQQALQQ
jgi:hypothetical protein